MKKDHSHNDFFEYPIQKYPLDTLDYYFNEAKQYKLIDRNTNVVSMGSCFGIEIAKYLKSLNFNYVLTEKNKFFSASWDKIYNTSSLKHIFEYSLKPDQFNPIVRWWKRPTSNLLQDPFRREHKYHPAKADTEFELHSKRSRKALEMADVITITLGMVELWRDRRDGYTYWRVPPRKYYDPEIHEFVIQDVGDVLNDMRAIRSMLPDTKIIWTVSPVPFMATFRQDTDPITANFNSKATLRSAADIMVREDPNSYYFPSFEAIILGHENRYQADNRHIQPGIVASMMTLFTIMYLDEGDEYV